MKSARGHEERTRALHRLKLVAVASSDCCLRRLFTLCAGSKQFQQHGVAFTIEFVNGPVGCLFLHAVDDCLLSLRTEFGDRAEIFPPRGYGPGEVLHEMVNSARTTGEMEQKIWPHHSPTEPRSPAHGRIRIGDIQYALLDEVNDLTVQRCLKAVSDVPDDLFADMNRFLANRFVKGERTLDSFRRCLFARYHFDERHHVRRIEGMADDATFGMLTSGLHRTHGQSG